MNYRHSYHAGNFADVIKHVMLIGLLESLAKKKTPFCYLDTHAGAAYYDLTQESSNKTKEYMGGIEKIIHTPNPPFLIKEYLNCIHSVNDLLGYNNNESLHFYPGSSMIAKYFMSKNDRIVACELQKDTYQELKTAFKNDKDVAIHHMDGYSGLKAFLPPKERRGVILIDPPYENPNEFDYLPKALLTALKRFATGVYALWYPIKEYRQLKRFYDALSALQTSILITEICILSDAPNRLNGSGMAIINPPWQLDCTLKEIVPWLWNSLKINDQGRYELFFLD